MPILDNEIDKDKEKLSTLIDLQEEYGEWCLRAIRNALYPDADRSDMDLSESLRNWAAESSDSQAVAVRRVMDLQSEMILAAREMMSKGLETQGKPPVELFDTFAEMYNSFILHLHRVEQEEAMSGSGVDMLTGLRSKTVLEQDMRKEMERLSRQGQVFSLALGRIDFFDEIKEQLGETVLDDAVTTVSGVIRNCARVFDEAYRLEENEFLVSLKQSDINGALSFLDRIKADLADHEFVIEINGEKCFLTVSFFVVEPVTNDDFMELIGLLRKELEREKESVDVSARYEEVSPLQRFVNDGGMDGALK